MNEDQGIFCPECGYRFTEDFGFCPRCGAEYRRSRPSAIGSANVRTEAPRPTDAEEVKKTQEAYMAYAMNIQKQIMESGRKLTIVMLLCWVILSAFLAAILLALPEDTLSDFTNITLKSSEMVFEGAVLLVSCVLAAVSVIAVYRKTKWKIAFVSCLASTVSVLLLLFVDDTTSIYFFLCGLLATLRVKNIKPLFS